MYCAVVAARNRRRTDNVSRILVTGANGHLGRRLINTLPPEFDVVALVRSRRARQLLLTHAGERPGLDVTIADPRDPAAVAEVGSGCSRVVHLIGTTVPLVFVRAAFFVVQLLISLWWAYQLLTG